MISPFVYSQSGPQTTAEKTAPQKIFRDRRVSSNAVDVISAEEIKRTYTVNAVDLIQTMSYTPEHVVKNANTQFNVRGVGANNTLTLVNGTRYAYTNNNRNMTYSQTLQFDVNKIPTAAIEQIEIITDAQGTVYGQDAVAGVINFINDVDERFINSGYKSHFTIPETDYSGVKNIFEKDWEDSVTTIFNSGARSTTSPDYTYGMNGTLSLTVKMNADFMIEEKNYYDGNNNLRQQVETEYYPEHYASRLTNFYDCSGKLDYSSLNLIDHYGYSYPNYNVEYENNKPLFGFFIPDLSVDKSFMQYLDVPDNTFRPNSQLPYKVDMGRFFKGLAYEYDKSACDDDDDIDFVDLDLTFRLEDFGSEKKVFPGVDVAYTNMIKPWVGLTVDAGINFGKVNDVKYTILSGFAGPTFVPCPKKHGLDDKLTLSVHTLAGYTNISQKFNNNSNSFGNFSLKLGVGGYYNLNDDWGIGIKGSDNMVFNKGNNSNNLNFEGGVRCKF